MPDARPSQAQLQESAEELFEDAPCAYLTTLPDGTIVRVNRTLERWTGYSREQLLDGRRFADLLTAGGRIYHETHYAPLLSMQGAVQEIAIEVRCADGSRLPVLANSVLKPDADGRPLLVRTTLFSATERRRYEDELRLAHDRERTLRERADRLQCVTAALSARLDVEGVADAALTQLVQLPGVLAAELALPASEDAEEPTLRRERSADASAVQAEATVTVLSLHAGGQSLGSLRLHTAGSRPPGEDDHAFYEAVSGQVSLALSRAAAHEQEAEVSHVLQRSLLDTVPLHDERLAVGTLYRPAIDGLEVGGDWYDTFTTNDGRVGAVVGDVVGRGVEAASAMGQLRSAVRALALAQIDGPAAVLTQLDRFATQVPGASMATLVYVELDVDTGKGRYASAGHPPPLLVRPGEEPAFLWDGRSLPLGITDVPRTEGLLTLDPGARLVLYTDGLVERRRESLDAGLARLTEELDRHREAAPQPMVEALADALSGDDAIRDDVCVLCVERAAP